MITLYYIEARESRPEKQTSRSACLFTLIETQLREVVMKQCNKCKEHKPCADFYKHKKNPDGLAYTCKDCVKAKVKLYMLTKPDKYKSYQRKYRELNKEKLNKRSAEFRANNKDRCNKSVKEWRENHQDRVRELSRIKSAKRRAMKRNSTVFGVVITPELINMRWDMWGGKCYKCGADAQETDHVKPLFHGGLHILSNMRPICGSCNRSKGAKWRVDGEQRFEEIG